MATVKFLYRSTKEIAPLTLRLSFRRDGKDFVFESKTPIVVSKKDWDLLGSPKRIKDAQLKNRKIDLDQKTIALEKLILNEFNLSRPNDISKSWLVRLVSEYYSINEDTNIPDTVLEYFPRFLDGVKNSISLSTQKRYKTAYTFLRNYCTETGDNPKINDVDPYFQRSFEQFAYDNDYAINTTSKYLSIIKTLCNYALENDNIELSHRFRLMRMKSKKGPIVYLNLDELKEIMKLTPDQLGRRLDNARDWLIISCFTGQRISDFMRFRPEDIREIDGVKVMDITQQKGNKQVTIPLFDPVQKIIQKYGGEFPRTISDQRFNEYAKEVARMAGLTNKVEGGKVILESTGKKRKEFGFFPKWELIASHVGRRSFATNFYGKIQTPLIMNVTGHTKESTFLGYIGKSSKDTAVETARAYQNLNINI